CARRPATCLAENAGGTCAISPVRPSIARSTAARSGAGAVRTTTPVRSSVSVSAPSATVASYTLGSPSRYGRSRVARPTRSTRSPVANGSSVPPCPTRLTPSARRAIATTSWDVTPAGLSTSSRPSIAGILVGRGRLVRLAFVAQLREQRFDARGVRGRFVPPEFDFGREPELERARDERAQVRGEAAQALEGRLLRGVVA